MAEHAKVIYSYHEAQKRRESFDLIAEFRSLARRAEAQDIRKAEMIDTWDILKYILQENERDSTHIVQPNYFEQYVGAVRKPEPDVQLRRKFIRGTRKFLESQYHMHMQNYVQSHLETAKPGMHHFLRKSF